MERKRPTRHVQTARIAMAEKKKPYEDRNLIDVKSFQSIEVCSTGRLYITSCNCVVDDLPFLLTVNSTTADRTNIQLWIKSIIFFSTWTCSSLNAVEGFPYDGARRLRKKLKKTGTLISQQLTKFLYAQRYVLLALVLFNQPHLNHRRDFCAQHMWVFLHILQPSPIHRLFFSSFAKEKSPRCSELDRIYLWPKTCSRVEMCLHEWDLKFSSVSRILINAITLVEGEVKGTGTGSQKHAARDIAANQALKALTDAGWSWLDCTFSNICLFLHSYFSSSEWNCWEDPRSWTNLGVLKLNHSCTTRCPHAWWKKFRIVTRWYEWWSSRDASEFETQVVYPWVTHSYYHDTTLPGIIILQASSLESKRWWDSSEDPNNIELQKPIWHRDSGTDSSEDEKSRREHQCVDCQNTVSQYRYLKTGLDLPLQASISIINATSHVSLLSLS